MPRQSEWFQHVPSALENLRQVSSLLITRRTLQALLRTSKRQAVRVMHALGGAEEEGRLTIERAALIRALEALQAGDAFLREAGRQQRLSEELARTRTQLQARRVRIPLPAETLDIGALPGVWLTGSRLVVEFDPGHPEDLLARLFQLAQAIGRDFERFQELATRVT